MAQQITGQSLPKILEYKAENKNLSEAALQKGRQTALAMETEPMLKKEFLQKANRSYKGKFMLSEIWDGDSDEDGSDEEGSDPEPGVDDFAEENPSKTVPDATGLAAAKSLKIDLKSQPEEPSPIESKQVPAHTCRSPFLLLSH